MPIILIIQREGEDVPAELKECFKRLQKELKDQYNIDILSDKATRILDAFEYKFRPMLDEFSENKIDTKYVAMCIQEYDERLQMLLSVSKYARERYKLDLSDEPYCNAIIYNREATTAEIQKMLHDGKSLEHCYRYLLKKATHFHAEPSSQKPN